MNYATRREPPGSGGSLGQRDRARRRGTICVEGNIGAGKTTFINYFRNRMHAQDVFEEPVRLWQNVGGTNLLQRFYEDPRTYAMSFQTYAQLTIIEGHRRRPRLMERSIFSARYCFVEGLLESGHLSRLDYNILDGWFASLAAECGAPGSRRAGFAVEAIVYLRCEPAVAWERARARSRAEEASLSLTYLTRLHQLHEEWLINANFPRPAPVLVVDANGSPAEMERIFHNLEPLIIGERA